MDITFPDDRPTTVSINWSIQFPAEVDGERVVNRVAFETLTEDFGAARAEESLSAFEKHAGEIRRIVRRKLEAGQRNDDGGADVLPGDRRRYPDETPAMSPRNRIREHIKVDCPCKHKPDDHDDNSGVGLAAMTETAISGVPAYAGPSCRRCDAEDSGDAVDLN